ncbi:MAG: flagellar biosynthetic protein FliQ [Vampirovibrionales bacterium]|nr:flagellar biosynthetic protein FliQ [Vampirovibrionales bacterium]
MESLSILTEHLGHGLGLALLLSLPPVLAAASIGLVVGILQAVTQVQEQTIAAAPKILTVFLVLLLGGGLMMTLLTNYIRESATVAFQEIPQASDFVLPPEPYNDEGKNRARAFFKAKASGESDAIDKLKVSPGVDGVSEGAADSPNVRVNTARYRSPLGPAEQMKIQEKRIQGN